MLSRLSDNRVEKGLMAAMGPVETADRQRRSPFVRAEAVDEVAAFVGIEEIPPEDFHDAPSATNS
jgi:hypothetical protein